MIRFRILWTDGHRIRSTFYDGKSEAAIREWWSATFQHLEIIKVEVMP